MRYAARQLSRGRAEAGAQLVRLSELMFAEAVRTYVNALPEDATGWLAGLRDPYVARALALIHAQPARAWTLETLAREVGLSRSALGERFARCIGMAPMRYLHRRRLDEAAQRLRNTPAPVSQIAHEVGYESEAAFSRSFKRAFGCSPKAQEQTVPD